MAIVDDRAGRSLFERRRTLRYTAVPGVRRVRLAKRDTLFHLAFRAYGDSRLWWAIADFNNIFDPTTETVEERDIDVPPRVLIEEYLNPTEP